MLDANTDILDNAEQLVLQLLNNLITKRLGVLKVPRQLSFFASLTAQLDSRPAFRLVSYKNAKSRHRFCLVVYILAEVHRLIVFGGSCMIRALYYRDVQLTRSPTYLLAAKLDVCRLLNTAPANIGILSAAKGLMAGDVKMFMSNGDILDWNMYSGAISLPTDYEKIEHIEAQAEFVLVVEKESVFQSLLSHDVFSTFGARFILMTGKGYPDYSTRRILHRLTKECKLPAYILVDADPFGIEIMLVYRHGSEALSFTSNFFATPMLRWIGLHPSEINKLANCALALSDQDNNKLVDMLRRHNFNLGVRQELCTLQRLQFKAEIESVDQFLSADYIPNKIKRNLFL